MILNRHVIKTERRLDDPTLGPDQQTRAARALESITRMTLDSAVDHPGSLADSFHLVPVWVIQTASLACFVQIEYGGTTSDSASDKGKIEAVKTFLAASQIKWNLAGAHF
jgi:hypothetical protein